MPSPLLPHSALHFTFISPQTVIISKQMGFFLLTIQGPKDQPFVDHRFAAAMAVPHVSPVDKRLTLSHYSAQLLPAPLFTVPRRGYCTAVQIPPCTLIKEKVCAHP